MILAAGATAEAAAARVTCAFKREAELPEPLAEPPENDVEQSLLVPGRNDVGAHGRIDLKSSADIAGWENLDRFARASRLGSAAVFRPRMVHAATEREKDRHGDKRTHGAHLHISVAARR